MSKPFAKTSTCTPVPITSGKLAAPAYLEISVDTLQPRNKYKISVAATPSVKDGFGLPLEASEGIFWTQATDEVMQGPNTGPIVVIDPADGFPETWPYILRGDGDAQSPKTIAYWAFKKSKPEDVTKIVTLFVNSQIMTSDVLGKPTATYDRGDSAVVLDAELDDDASVHVFSTCCEKPGGDSPAYSTNLQVILKSGYSVTWTSALTAKNQVIAWVNGPNGKPAAGVTAMIYQHEFQYPGITTPKLVARCTTSDDGSCAVALPSAGPYNNINLYGVAVAKGKIVGVASIGSGYGSTINPYKGSLVLDRALVRPGDALHVTGYIVQKNDAAKSDKDLSVTAPNITKAALQISPSLTGGDSPTM